MKTARGPDGHLVFGWCADCRAEADFVALGLHAPKSAKIRRRPRSRPKPELEPIVPGPPRPEDRARAVGSLALILVVWGLLLVVLGAGSVLGFGPPDDGFGPTGVGRLRLFAASGATMAVVGAWVGLTSVDRVARRRALALAVETVAACVGLGLLVAGIAYHDPRRDPWIVLGVGLAGLAAWSARRWAAPAGRRTPTLPSV